MDKNTKAKLLLEDGTLFSGYGFGSEGTTIGEVVFNTGMTGYQEILTDPSYKGQMVTMTYPHIGNYGINDEDIESVKPQVEALIVRELSEIPSNYRSNQPLDRYLKNHNITGIHQIDTRALTRHIRERGSMMGILTTDEHPVPKLKEKLDAHPKIEGRDLVQYVTIKKSKKWNFSADEQWYYKPIRPLGKNRYHIAAYDFGIKQNILRLMVSIGFDVTVLPASTPAEKIRALSPDGIFLSNGPGDPAAVDYGIDNIKKLLEYRPLFGICLGHQILGLALGAETFKLKFGHHGSNHPVKNCKTEEIEITAQNHNYALDPDSVLKAELQVTHINLNDQTIEGIKHPDLPIFSVQYHPEASPGPHDSLYLFKTFHQMMESYAKTSGH